MKITLKLNRITEISKFYLGPAKEQMIKKNVRSRGSYLNSLKNKNVVPNTFLLESYHAVSLTGNVYALFTQLIEEKQLETAKFYWVTTNLDNKMIKLIKNKYPKCSNIYFIKYESKQYFELLATCKYLINDTSFLPYFNKRDEQIYVNTWHGTPLKTLGLDIKNAQLSDHKNIQRNFLHTDFLLMPNQFTADKLIKSHDLDGILNSKVYVTGNSRVDLTLTTKKDEIIELLDLPRDKKMVLYAPTWKKTVQDTTELDILNLMNEVEKIQLSLGKEYKVLLKTHYFIYDYFVEHGFEDKVVPNWVDTNELLACIDKLITDYSSIFFDFLPTKRPVYFYIPDKDIYKEERGFYLDLNGLPGALCTTIEELCQQLMIEDTIYATSFNSNYNNYLTEFCSDDDGKSRKRAIDIFLHNNVSDKKQLNYLSTKKKLVFYCGGFFNNGITMSAVNLSKNMDYDKYEVIFMDTDKMRAEKSNNIKKVDPRVHFIYKFGAVNRDYKATIRQNLLYRQGMNSDLFNKEKTREHLSNEFKRVTGKLPIDVLIDFGGYNKMFTALFAMADVPKKAIFLHNVMLEEYNKVIGNKYKHKWNLKVIFSLYHNFDKIVSVSESANEQNQKDLKHYVPGYKEKMVFVNNTIDGDSILNSIHVDDPLNHGQDIYSSEDNRARKVFYEKTDSVTGIVTLKGFMRPNKNHVNFVNVARLSPEKNHLVLIDAFAKLVKENSNCHLYILGTGPLDNDIKRKISEVGLKKHVHMLGYMENPSMFVYLCDCFILTSNYEGQGLVLLEAMIIGKPVIGTDVPGIHSVLENSRGLLVNNSVEEIYQGMREYIDGKISTTYFDYKSYNKETLNDFYQKVCES